MCGYFRVENSMAFLNEKLRKKKNVVGQGTFLHWKPLTHFGKNELLRGKRYKYVIFAFITFGACLF